MDASYLQALEAWRRQKDVDLRQRQSWLALAGLHWLVDGRLAAGSSETSEIRLPPSAPPWLGDFEVRDGQVYFDPDRSLAIEGLPRPGMPLQPDTTEDPTFLRLGDLTLVVIARRARLGLRVWDEGRLASTKFEGRTWYAPDPRFVVDAIFEPADAGATIPVPSVTGDVSDELLIGTAHFAVADRQVHLQAVPADGDRLEFLFADATNGRTTYPSGRFLIAGRPQAGAVVLDFNRAYNPPCAFTAFATCPLPPPANHLPVLIEAGETYVHGR